mmetsp:Transcript_126958/g.355573  ORF Transcript_126958/g.355573 Transcript_126958/m.355573 type:complete len:229 (+) Transcript_126958:761-1447(+)
MAEQAERRHRDVARILRASGGVLPLHGGRHLVPARLGRRRPLRGEGPTRAHQGDQLAVAHDQLRSGRVSRPARAGERGSALGTVLLAVLRPDELRDVAAPVDEGHDTGQADRVLEEAWACESLHPRRARRFPLGRHAAQERELRRPFCAPLRGLRGWARPVVVQWRLRVPLGEVRSQRGGTSGRAAAASGVHAANGREHPRAGSRPRVCSLRQPSRDGVLEHGGVAHL